jgi:hypothetical protein
LILFDCTFAGNATGSGNTGGTGGTLSSPTRGANGGDGGAGGNGGGICSLGILTIQNCTISGNLTAQGGNGGHAGIGSASGHDQTGNGGAGGTGGSGGGVYSFGNSIIQSCTISSNLTAQGGTGGRADDFGIPGTNGLSGVAGSGGGIFSISNNLQIVNTIIANNATPTNSLDVAGNFLSLGFNLVGNTNGSIGFGAAGDLIGVDPLLAPLTDNNGPTWTMALLPGSPAIDAGTSVGAPNTDQRGVPRTQGSNPDIGAFEFIFSHVMKFTDVQFDQQNGQVQFSLSGVPGDVYQILASTNLVNWLSIATVTNMGGIVQFTDTASTNYSRRFYRVVMP